MRNIFMKSILLLLLATVYVSSSAQEQKARWASDKGYWIVESNVNQPRDHTIRFYTNENDLIYQESLKNVKFNATRRKEKMKLKKALEAAVLAWEKTRRPSEEVALVKNSL